MLSSTQRISPRLQLRALRVSSCGAGGDERPEAESGGSRIPHLSVLPARTPSRKCASYLAGRGTPGSSFTRWADRRPPAHWAFRIRFQPCVFCHSRAVRFAHGSARLQVRLKPRRTFRRRLWGAGAQKPAIIQFPCHAPARKQHLYVQILSIHIRRKSFGFIFPVSLVTVRVSRM